MRKGLVVNLDKQTYLDPAAFGDSADPEVFITQHEGTMMALGILCADGNGRGGGDFDNTEPPVGSWAGDHIIIAVSDGPVGEHCLPGVDKNLYDAARLAYTDFSDEAVAMFLSAGSREFLDGLRPELPRALRPRMRLRHGQLPAFLNPDDAGQEVSIAALLKECGQAPTVTVAQFETRCAAMLKKLPQLLWGTTRRLRLRSCHFEPSTSTLLVKGLHAMAGIPIREKVKTAELAAALRIVDPAVVPDNRMKVQVTAAQDDKAAFQRMLQNIVQATPLSHREEG